MATTSPGKRKASNVHRASGNKKGSAKRRPLITSGKAVEIVSHISDATKKQLQIVGKRLQTAKEKEARSLQDISGKIRQFVITTSQLTKLKIEIHNLKEEHENLLQVMGENLWNMHKAGKTTRIQSKFKYDFQKLKDLEKELSAKKRAATRATSFLKKFH